MNCVCRKCEKVYDHRKSRAEYRGYCSAKCQHDMAKSLGWNKAMNRLLGLTEYTVLDRNKQVGDIPVVLGEVTKLFNAEPKYDIKTGWSWKLGPQNIARFADKLLQMEGVVIEWQRESLVTKGKWLIVRTREDATGAIVKIPRP